AAGRVLHVDRFVGGGAVAVLVEHADAGAGLAFGVGFAGAAELVFADGGLGFGCAVAVFEALDADAGVDCADAGAAVVAAVGAIDRLRAAGRRRDFGVLRVTTVPCVAAVSVRGGVHVPAHERLRVARLPDRAVQGGVAVARPQRLRVAPRNSNDGRARDPEPFH